MDRYLALDIGGTFLKYSIMDENYHVTEENAVPTEREPGRFLSQLLAVVNQYRQNVKGIGICMAGFINPDDGWNRDFSVRESFRIFNLKEEFERESGLPVIIENDSNCALIGEMAVGQAMGRKNVLLLTIGTAIGGALAIEGKLYRGSHYKAGEAGFIELNGKRAGATATLVKEVSEAVGHEVDGYFIFEHLDDPKVYSVYSDWLKRLAYVVGDAGVLLDPEVLLIGGGICIQERFMNDLRNMVYEIFPHFEEYTQIVACSTGNRAGMTGAIALLRQKD